MDWETRVKEREESRVILRLVASRFLMTSMMLMQVRKFPGALNIFLLMSHRSGLGYWIMEIGFPLFRTIKFHCPRPRGVAHLPEHIAGPYLNKMEVPLGRKNRESDT